MARKNIPNLRVFPFTRAYLKSKLDKSTLDKLRKESNVDCMELQQFTSLPFSISTLAKRAIKTNLGIPPLPGSATGFSESLISFECNPKEEKKNIYIYIFIYIRTVVIRKEFAQAQRGKRESFKIL